MKAFASYVFFPTVVLSSAPALDVPLFCPEQHGETHWASSLLTPETHRLNCCCLDRESTLDFWGI